MTTPETAPDVVREAIEHLSSRGVAPPGVLLQVVPLAGGESNDVFAVTGLCFDVVVNRALGTLRVAEEWKADPARLPTEGRALRLAQALLPGSVPAVVDLDDHFLVVERAPHDWSECRTELMRGFAEPGVASQLGHALGIWQERTRLERTLAAAFADREAFHQLRVDPFHHTVLRRHPDLAAPIQQTGPRVPSTSTR